MTSPPCGLQTTQHWWPDPEEGPWVVTLRWTDVDGRPECVGLDISQPGQVGQPIVLAVSTVLRPLPVAEWIAEDRAAMMPAAAPVRGLRKSTLDRLQAVADVYRAAAQEKQPPVKAVAAHFGLSKGGASNLITRARQVGLLPPTSQGVANAGK